MSERHLKTGSELPPSNPDTLRIYSMLYCPYAQRTRLVLLHKNIAHETVNVNLKEKPAWFLSLNPAGLVPVLEYKGHVICESSICDEYLDDQFPQRPLMPSCPFKRAKCRLLMYKFDQGMSKAGSIAGLVRPDADIRKTSSEKFEGLIEECENWLKESKGAFFMGDEVSMVDFHLWPFFERFPGFNLFGGYHFLTPGKHPLVDKWIEAMKNLDAVKATFITPEVHNAFMETYVKGVPQYDDLPTPAPMVMATA